METVKKIWKSKTLKEMMINIPYNALEWCAFIIITLFIANPFFKAIISIYENERLNCDFFEYWHKYNPYVLLYGSFILLLYLIKLKIDNKLNNIKSTLNNNPSIFLFGIYAFLMCISTIVNGFPEFSLFGQPYCGGGLFGELSYIIFFLLAIICSKLKYTRRFFAILAFTSVTTLILTTYDHIVLKRYYNYVQGYTIFSNSNHYGYYILVIAMCFATFFVTSKIIWNKLIHLVIFMFATGVLLMNDTFGCQIALLIAIIFVCIVYSITKCRFVPSTLILLLAFFTTCILGYSFSSQIRSNINNNFSQFSNDVNALKGNEHEGSSGVSRLLLWERTIVHISEKPLLGHAADGTNTRLVQEAHWGRCHNDYLHYAVCFGIPAATIYVIAIFLIYIRALKNKKLLNAYNLVGLCASFAYLVSAFFANTMFYTAPYLFIMLGLGYYKTNK